MTADEFRADVDEAKRLVSTPTEFGPVSIVRGDLVGRLAGHVEAMLARVAELEDANRRFAERIAAQSELLSRKAAANACPTCGQGVSFGPPPPPVPAGWKPGPRCNQCDGEGVYAQPGWPMAPCPGCNGAGRLWVPG